MHDWSCRFSGFHGVDQIYLEQISIAHQIKTKNYCSLVKHQAIILGNTWARRSAGVSSYFEPKLH